MQTVLSMYVYLHTLSLFTLFYMVCHTDMNFDLATCLYNAYMSLPYTYVYVYTELRKCTNTCHCPTPVYTEL